MNLGPVLYLPLILQCLSVCMSVSVCLCLSVCLSVIKIQCKFNQCLPCKNEWMDDLRFYLLFNHISDISGLLEGDNEKLCVMDVTVRMI